MKQLPSCSIGCIGSGCSYHWPYEFLTDAFPLEICCYWNPIHERKSFGVHFTSSQVRIRDICVGSANARNVPCCPLKIGYLVSYLFHALWQEKVDVIQAEFLKSCKVIRTPILTLVAWGGETWERAGESVSVKPKKIGMFNPESLGKGGLLTSALHFRVYSPTGASNSGPCDKMSKIRLTRFPNQHVDRQNRILTWNQY